MRMKSEHISHIYSTYTFTHLSTHSHICLCICPHIGIHSGITWLPQFLIDLFLKWRVVVQGGCMVGHFSENSYYIIYLIISYQLLVIILQICKHILWWLWRWTSRSNTSAANPKKSTDTCPPQHETVSYFLFSILSLVVIEWRISEKPEFVHPEIMIFQFYFHMFELGNNYGEFCWLRGFDWTCCAQSLVLMSCVIQW